MASPNMISEKEKLGAASEKSRTLIVQKDDCGYGLTLSGDRPTRVQTVKPGGASHKAGVREGDVIIKVNGQPVTESFHSEVVKLIQNSKYVALTVVHHSCLPLTSSGSALELLKIGSGDPPTGPGPGSEELKRSQSNRNSSTSITNPQPVSEDGQKKLVSEKLYNLKLMVEQENRYIEELRTTHARTNSPKTKKELDKALKNLARLNDQLRQFSPDKPPLATPPGPTNDIKARLGLPPLPTSPDSTPAAPPRRESISLNPPPLPARNKGFAGSPDAPPPPPRSISSSALPPPPPKLNSRHGSHENVSRAHHRRGSQVGPGANSPVKTPTEGNLPTVIHQRTRSSPCSLEQTLEAQHSWSPSNEKFSLDDRSSSPRYETPPGTPPPPYNDNPSHTPGSNHTPYIELSPTHLVTWDGLLSETNLDGEIMTMDSDDDDEPCDNAGLHLPPEGDHGPFNNLQELLQHAAHLAVFLNYVISNADPSCLLFYLITDAYKLGSAKEMRKWAYEIHSCFLVPHAPVEIPGLDHQVIGNIDTFLAEENSEREEFLLKLFWKARSRARDVLKVQLDDFRATRAAGLGAIFGPNDHELRLCDENVGKRNQVIDDLLVPVLETMSEDLENATDRSSTMASSLATVLSKTFVTKSPVANSIIEKCPTFVSKEKRKEKFFGRNRKNLTIQGHHFVLKHYDQVTYCNQSQGIIWGIGPQGYQCSNCSFDVHKKFVQKVEETCVGPSSDKKKRNRTSMFHLSRLSDVGRIMSKDQLLEPGRKASGPGSSSVSPSPSIRLPGDVNASVNETSSDATDSTFDLNRMNNLDTSNADTSSAEGPFGRSPSILDQLLASSNQNREGRGVKRSESAKDGAKRAQPRHYTRKHSDPNLGPRMSIDSVEMGPSVNSGSSSSSSIPGAVELRPWDSPHLFMATENVPSVHIAPHTVDSDLEIENDPPDWRLSISIEQLQKLKPKQRKRQDVINELFHTERSHVRNLKVLSNIFRRPLIESGLMPREVVDRLFPNIDDVLTVHQRYNGAMKDRMKRGFPIGNIGDILGDMFMGVAGEHLINVGAKFTKNQKFTIEELKRMRNREGSKLDQLLDGIEKNPVCRKLQLQDLLAVEHQRLVKYPLLLEQIARVTDEDQDEASIVKKSVLRTKEILEVIDKQVAEAQNKQQLVEIQRALDTSGLDKHVGSDHPICLEYKNIDLTKHRLIHEGCLTMKLGDTRRIKTIDLYVLLLEDCIMLLQKEGEKFLLKFHMSTAGMMQSRGDDNRKLYHSPIIKFSSMLVRPVATDKRAFYLLNTTQVGPQIYELVASSPGDRKTWFTHIESTAASYKQREARRVGGFKDMDSRSLSGDIKVETGRLSVPEDLDKKAAASPAGRSQSFHEQSVSQRLPAPPSRPQSVPQEQVEVEAETAETVRSKIETLWRKDEEVARALEEKQRLVADILRIPEEEFEVGEGGEAPSGQGDAREVLLAVLAQAENLTSLVNQSLKVTEEEGEASALAKEKKRFPGPPGDKLIAITTTMNQHLTSLLTIIQEREEERERWRRELARSQEQVRACMVGSSDRMMGSSVTSPMTSCSRPNSYISLESDSERCPDSECDVSNASGGRCDVSGGKMEESFSLDLPQKETTPTNENPPTEGGGLLVLQPKNDQMKRNGNECGEELRDVEGVIEDNINNNSGGGESLTLVDVEAGETEDSTC